MFRHLRMVIGRREILFPEIRDRDPDLLPGLDPNRFQILTIMIHNLGGIELDVDGINGGTYCYGPSYTSCGYADVCTEYAKK
jgi:hypothetical protein